LIDPQDIRLSYEMYFRQLSEIVNTLAYIENEIINNETLSIAEKNNFAKLIELHGNSIETLAELFVNTGLAILKDLA